MAIPVPGSWSAGASFRLSLHAQQESDEEVKAVEPPCASSTAMALLKAAPGHDHAERQLATQNRFLLEAFGERPSAAPVQVYDCPWAQGAVVWERSAAVDRTESGHDAKAGMLPLGFGPGRGQGFLTQSWV